VEQPLLVADFQAVMEYGTMSQRQEVVVQTWQQPDISPTEL
jgi:hypothetical protein